MACRHGFITSRPRTGFTCLRFGSPRSPGLLMPCRVECHSRQTLLPVRPFAPPGFPGFFTTTASADFSRRLPASPFQAQGEISPGKVRTPSPHNRRIYTTSPWSRELRGYWPARPARQCLVSGSCYSPHPWGSPLRGQPAAVQNRSRRFCRRLAVYAPRFLPTVGHPSAVALHFTRRDQLVAGLSPAGVRPCWAHQRKRPTRPGWPCGIGGGGGSRTRVREPSALGSTCLVCQLCLTALPPDRQGIHYGDSGKVLTNPPRTSFIAIL